MTAHHRSHRLLSILVVLVALSFAGCATLQAPPADASPQRPPAPETTRIGSFNIHYDAAGEESWPWRARRKAVCDLILAEAPDIVGLQEVTSWDAHQILPSVQIQDLAEMLPEYALAGASPRDSIFSSNPILYRKDKYELLETGVIYFKRDPLEPPEEPMRRIGTRFSRWARFRDLETGRRLVVANAHYHHLNGVNRMRASRVLVRRLPSVAGDDPFVIVGDLNAFVRSSCVRWLRRELELEDALGDIRDGTFHGPSGRPPWPRIDHIFVPSGTLVIRSWISYVRPEGVLPSDHYPVFADVRL